MFIKSLKLEGFKSYKNQTVFGPFHEGFNIVVGRNGSGKSNFFSAIEFVLSEEYTHLRAEQRSALISTSAGGPRPINAYVEILFDNEERRFPLNQDEIVLRRTIGTKKDQFHLGGKVVTRKELSGLLAAAGFSQSNPYYIVKQGQIQHMATCSAKDKLKIIKDLAGTKVYDEKRVESMKDLATAEKIILQVQESLSQITERHNQLEAEKEDFVAFQKLDSKRRTLEYVILNKDLAEIYDKEQDINTEYKESVEKFKTSNIEIHEITNDIEMIKEEISVLKQEVEVTSNELKDQMEVHEQKLKVKANLELKLIDVENETQSQSQIAEDLEDLQDEISNMIDEKVRLEESLGQNVGEYENLKQSLELLEHRREEVVKRSGRRKLFTNIAARDKWIDSEMKGTQTILETSRLQAVDLRRKLHDDQAILAERDQELVLKREEIISLESSVKESKDVLQKLNEKKFNVNKAIAAKAKEVHSSQISKEQLKEEFFSAEAKIKSIKSMRNLLRGAESIQTLMNAKPHFQAGYDNMLYNLFECGENLLTVVDQTAGLRSFYHVVDTRATATRIIRELNRLKYPGEFNFMPRDTVKPLQSSFEDGSTDEGFSLMSKLEMRDEDEDIIGSVFGATIVVRSLENAGQLATRHRADCITLDGDKRSRQGVLRGGYLDPSKNRLRLYRGYLEASARLDDCHDKLSKTEAEMTALKEMLSSTSKGIIQSELKLMNSERSLEKSKHSLRLSEDERNQLFTDCIKLEKDLSSAETNIKMLETTLNNLQNEKGEDFNSQLATGFDDIIRMIQEKKSSVKSTSAEVEAMEKEWSNLVGRIEIAQKKAEVLSFKANDKSDKDLMEQKLRNDLELVTGDILEIFEGLKRKEASDVETQQRLKKSKDHLENKEVKLASLKEFASSGNRIQESLLEKKASLMKSEQLTKNKLNNIEGGVNPDMTDRLEEESRSTLSKLLKKVLKDLKKYENVNKKALEQFEAFAERDNLEERLDQLLEGKVSIETLIESLDEKKEEQVCYTFKQVKKNFENVFRKIVPSGMGNLIVSVPEDEDDEELSEHRRVAEADGVEIQVSFTGDGVMKSMSQLSGGQKSVVALSLVLALQQCDPAPFYLFDEVDAALDIEFRSAVAAIIKEQASSASTQFIATTFRREMVERADKFFGVIFRGTSSYVQEVEQTRAYDFVVDDAIQN